jgi:hypothetical protein
VALAAGTVVSLGFNDEQAMLLARSEADLSQARYLRSSGCSCTLALSIVL